MTADDLLKKCENLGSKIFYGRYQDYVELRIVAEELERAFLELNQILILGGDLPAVWRKAKPSKEQP